MEKRLDRPMRSMLYVPGNRGDWVRKSAKYGADAIVIDFEDSVPDAEVPAAREALAENAAALRENGQDLIVLRPNAIQRGGLHDVEAAAAAPIDAVMVPKANAAVIATTSERLDELGSSLGIVPILETPEAMRTSWEVASASERNVGIWGGSGARNGDCHTSLGFEWTVEMTESLYISSQTVLHARAAGLDHIVGGAWVNLDDADGLRRHVQGYRRLGFTGYVAIHPSQVPVIHDVFRPSAEEIDSARRTIDAMREAEAQGLGAVRMGEDMIDYATLRMAERVLKLAER
jgi:citrate lyase subunit beta/citryl-CoA lyase